MIFSNQLSSPGVLWIMGGNFIILVLIFLVYLNEAKHQEQYQPVWHVLLMTIFPFSLICSVVFFMVQISFTSNAIVNINKAKDISQEYKMVLERYVDCVTMDGEIISSHLSEKCMSEELDKAGGSKELTMKIFNQAKLSLL
jgi:uncharacterized membrane protein